MLSAMTQPPLGISVFYLTRWPIDQKVLLFIYLNLMALWRGELQNLLGPRKQKPSLWELRSHNVVGQL